MSSAEDHDDDEPSFNKEGFDSHAPRYGPVKSAEGWVVFVSGLHGESQEDDILDAFSDHGHVKQVKLNFERKTGLGKGYALVEFERRTEAQDCINKMHGKEFMGSTISVHWAFVKPIGQPASTMFEARR